MENRCSLVISPFRQKVARHFWLINLAAWLSYAMIRIAISATFIYTGKIDLYSTVCWSLASFINGVFISLGLYFIYNRIDFKSLKVLLTSTVLLILSFSYLLSIANIILGSILTGQLCCETSIFRRALFHWPEQLSLIAAWVSAYLGIRFYLQSINDRSRAAEATAAANKAESKMLRYQLQPHILFNSLNTISGLIVGDRGKEADRMVQNLGHFLQHMLSTNTHDLITLNEEISYVERYLKIEEIRFENRLTIQIDIATEIKQALVPAFILQPLVENSIKHGLNTSARKCHIGILATLENQTIKIVVDTKVKGGKADYQPENSLGIGEKNISNRLKLHYGEKAEFFAERPVDNLYRAIVIIPLIKAITSNNPDDADEC